MTVGELIEKLRQFPPDAPVELCDADTNWTLPIHVTLHVCDAYGLTGNPETVYIWGDYSEAE